jgi:hypothetical protein
MLFEIFKNFMNTQLHISKSKTFLFERISLDIQRGNAASIRGTFPDSALLSEIFIFKTKMLCT